MLAMAPRTAPKSIAEAKEHSEDWFDFDKLTPEEQADYLAAIEEGRADIRAGRMVPADKVRLWIESLGTDHELPPPECE
jgi:predicted transcriptional regulator